MIDNSLMELLKQIVKNPKIKIEDFIQINNISHRQFLIKLKQLNEYLESKNFQSIQIENQLLVFDEKLELFLLDEIFADEYKLLFKEKLRVPLIYLYTFIRQEAVSNYHFQWLLRVSKNTILADMKILRNECLKYQVQFNYSRKDGYHLVGSEMDKRRIALVYLNEVLEYSIGKKALQYILRSWALSQKVEEVQQLIKRVLGQEDLQIPLSRLDQLAYLYQFLLVRKKYGLRFTLQQLEVLETHPMVKVAGNISRHFHEENQLEIYYLAVQLLAVVEGNQFDPNIKNLEPHVRMIIQNIEQLMVVHFDKPIELYRGLLLHLLPAYYRLLFDIPIQNELTEQMRLDYPFLFDVVQKSLSSLEFVVGKTIPLQEVAFLTMYFGGKLRQNQRVQEDLHALVVCPNGVSTSYLLKNQLEQLFPTFKWKVSSYTDQLEIDSANMIFSTASLKADVPVYVTKPILSIYEKNYLIEIVGRDFNINGSKLPTSHDIISIVEKYATIFDKEALEKTLNQYIQQHSYSERKENPMLKDLLTPEYIHFSNEQLSWQEALKLACMPLEESGHITDRYVEAIMDRVKTFGPYIHLGRGVAIPHARPEDGVKKLGMSFLKLSQPVLLDDKEEHAVDVLITLAAIDNSTHLDALSELTKILSSPDKLSQLKEAIHVEDVLKIINYEEEN